MTISLRFDVIINFEQNQIIELINIFFSFRCCSISAGGIFGVRHFQAFLLFLGLTLAYAMRVNLSVAIVAMTDRHAANPNFEVNFNYNLFFVILIAIFC